MTRRASLEAAFSRMWDHLVVADRVEPCDAILCFGSCSPSVPATAALLHAQGVAPLVVVSGGGRMADGRREGDAYAADLVGRGVPSSSIIVEREARHTGENVALGLAALPRELRIRRIAAVSWALAMRRAVATLGHHRPDLEVVAVPALPDDRPRWDATHHNVQDALGEWDRLEAYSRRGIIAAQPWSPEVADAAHLLRSAIDPQPGLVRSRPGAPRSRTGPRVAGAPAPSRG